MRTIKNKIAKSVIEYFSINDPSQITHTLSVAYYTRLIADKEGYLQREATLLEIAALLHDIGCPVSKLRYGDTLPANQQEVGKEIAPQFISEFNEISDMEKKRIVDIVGSHHQISKVSKLHFEALFDADAIVNIIEGYYKKETVGHLLKSMHTSTGAVLLNALIQGGKL